MSYKQKVRRVTVDLPLDLWEELFAESVKRLMPIAAIIRERLLK